MKAEDYKHVVSVSDEPPLAENIILDGNVMPLRNVPKDKIKPRGEDICFLFEAGARFERVAFGTASVREFTRKLKASQAQDALEEITRMFQSGYALKSLPKAGGFFVLENRNDYMAPFDVLTLDDCEPMEPVPEVGGEILAAPFQAAFRNFEKIKGRGMSFSSSLTYSSSSAISVFAEKYFDSLSFLNGDGRTIHYVNVGMGPLTDIDGENEPVYFRGVQAPVANGENYLPSSANEGYLNGVKCLSGTVWRLSIKKDLWEGGEGCSSGIERYVLMLDSEWRGPENGTFTELKCSTEEAMGILDKLCNAAAPDLWAEALGDYTSLPKLTSRQYNVFAYLDYHVGIAAVDDCLKEGFNK
jgi:hypothetical protein